MAMPLASPYTKHPPKPEMAMPIHRGAVIAQGTIEGFGSWSLDEQGLLYIHGSGKMPDWEDGSKQPWKDVEDKIQSLRIADGVTSIGEYAFWYCRSLTKIHLPDSLTSIEWNAFSGCSSLKEIRLPDKLTNIGGYAFQDCSSLTEVYLPDSLTSIKWHAFYGCSSLTEIHIPKSVTELGTEVFAGCTGLRKVTMPARFKCFFLNFKEKYGIPKSIVTFI